MIDFWLILKIWFGCGALSVAYVSFYKKDLEEAYENQSFMVFNKDFTYTLVFLFILLLGCLSFVYILINMVDWVIWFFQNDEDDDENNN